jgi:hypothetical protein
MKHSILNSLFPKKSGGITDEKKNLYTLFFKE